jgi:acetyl-CoA carboxylase biotin carboxyl carrier protein
MNLRIIKQLVEILKEVPEVGTIEIRRGPLGAWTTVRVSKAGHGGGGNATGAGGGHVIVTAAPTGPAAAPAAPGAAPAAPAAAPPPAAPAAQLFEIKSPMVGTFFAAPEPGAPAYVKVGSRLAPGQTVCIIEAMKIMNEIESEVTGVIREVCVENAQPVEFGQVLFRVDTHG